MGRIKRFSSKNASSVKDEARSLPVFVVRAINHRQNGRGNGSHVIDGERVVGFEVPSCSDSRPVSTARSLGGSLAAIF